MAIKDQDIYDIAEYIVNNVRMFIFQFKSDTSTLAFKDYVQSIVEKDLNYKYNRYDMEDMFSDPRIDLLFQMIQTNQGDRHDPKIKIH